MYKKAKFLFFCMIFVGSYAKGQIYTIKTATDAAFFNAKPVYSAQKSLSYRNYFPQSKKILQKNTAVAALPAVYINVRPCSVISADLYTRNFGFFCKQELQFEKATKIPLRFRLGSLQYNNYLEGKPNSGILPAY